MAGSTAASRSTVLYTKLYWDSAKLQVDSSTLEKWRRKQLLKITDCCESKNVYNGDEAGLFSGLYLCRHFCLRGNPCCGRKSFREKVTVLLICNAFVPDTLSRFVTGKNESPRCFKNVRKLPSLMPRMRFAVSAEREEGATCFNRWHMAV